MRLFPKHRDLATAPERVELLVDASDLRRKRSEVHLRLDHFLSLRLHWRSRSSVQRLIEDGHILVDVAIPGHPAGSGEASVERKPARRLRHGSRVVIEIPEGERLPARCGGGDGLVVLYEDDVALAVDKPPHVTVHPAGRHLTGTLIQRIHASTGAASLPRERRPRLCHRLDRETSGIVLVGKDPISHSRMMGQFEKREVKKEYLAIVHGVPSEPRGTIDDPLASARASSIGLRMAIAAGGLPSRTDWELLETFGRFSLLACRLHTGRQHQIRVHLEAMGHPIVGDKIYGHDGGAFQRSLDGELTEEDRRRLLLDRHALHHHRLEFTSPRTGRRQVVESPLAEDLVLFLERCSGG